MKIESGSKNIQVETLRGMACFFLVIYHVIGPPGGGLKLPDDSFYRYLNETFLYIRMPLFTFLSGYVYAFRPMQPTKWSVFCLGKLRRLYLPLIFVGIPFALIQLYAPGVNKPPSNFLEIFSVLYKWDNHFWFLQALIIIFIIIIVVERLQLINSLRGAFVFWLIAAVIFLANRNEIRFFSLYGAIYLLPFFLLGMMLNRYKQVKENIQKYKSHIIVTFVFVLVIHQFSLFGFWNIDNNRTGLYSLLMGSTGCFFLYLLNIENKSLAKIGHYSFTIYLFHPYGAVFSRVFLNNIGIENYTVLVGGGLFCGLFFPIVIHYIISKSNLLGFLFLGKNWREKKYIRD